MVGGGAGPVIRGIAQSRFRWIFSITLKTGNTEIPEIAGGVDPPYDFKNAIYAKSGSRRIEISHQELGDANAVRDGGDI